MKGNNTKRFATFALLALLVAALSMPSAAAHGAPVAQTPPERIRIYSSFPAGPQATALINAMNLALEQQARNGLVCRSKYQLEHVLLNGPTVISATASLTGTAIAATPTARATTRPISTTVASRAKADAQTVVNDPDAMLFFGSLDAAADKVMLPVFAAANLLMISPSDAYPGLTKPWDAGEPQAYQPNGTLAFARVIPSDDVQGEMGAKWAKSMGVRRVTILHDGSVRGKGLADAFRATAKSISLVEEGYEDLKAATSKSALIDKIKGSEAQMVYLGTAPPTDAGAWVKDMRAAGLDELLILGNDSLLDASVLRATGADVNRLFATAPGFPQAKLPAKGKRFYTDYQKRYQTEPLPIAIYGFEAMSVAVRVIGSVCQKDRAVIRAAVLATKNFNGVLGTWAFDAAGDTSLKSMQGYHVVEGNWESAGPLIFK